MQVREKVGKSRNTVFFQWFVAAEGRKVGSLKRRVRSHLARREMKIARRCGAKHISNSKCTKHLSFGALLEVAMSKKCTPLHISKSKCTKHTSFGALLDVEKMHAVVARSTFEVKSVKNWRSQTSFGRSDVVSCGRCKGFCTLSKASKMWGFLLWQAWDIRRGSGQMLFAWQAQYKRHAHQRY